MSGITWPSCGNQLPLQWAINPTVLEFVQKTFACTCQS
jgi:hypothetical protein